MGKIVYIIPERASSTTIEPILKEYYYYLNLWIRCFKCLYSQKLREVAIKLQSKIFEEYQKEYINFLQLEEKPDILLMDRSHISTIIFMDLMVEEGIITNELIL